MVLGGLDFRVDSLYWDVCGLAYRFSGSLGCMRSILGEQFHNLAHGEDVWNYCFPGVSETAGQPRAVLLNVIKCLQSTGLVLCCDIFRIPDQDHVQLSTQHDGSGPNKV